MIVHSAKGTPPTPDELKMIFNGKVLENARSFQGKTQVSILKAIIQLVILTLSEYKVPAGTLVNMHLQPTPSQRSSAAAPAAAKPAADNGR